jgi:hypothetical protein
MYPGVSWFMVRAWPPHTKMNCWALVFHLLIVVTPLTQESHQEWVDFYCRFLPAKYWTSRFLLPSSIPPPWRDGGPAAITPTPYPLPYPTKTTPAGGIFSNQDKDDRIRRTFIAGKEVEHRIRRTFMAGRGVEHRISTGT